MPRGVRMPSDDVPDSWDGDTTLAVCGSCGRVAYVPADTPGRERRSHCTGCKSLVRWL